ncbi:alpha/beta hydrolase family protein [Sphingobacterium sp. MYb388]|uniref:alpha/beta hydrolase family protein n=1 Tax=Sphingobacterium sp. MYb388 TaxID=2745437 RepID=UPI00309B2814
MKDSNKNTSAEKQHGGLNRRSFKSRTILIGASLALGPLSWLSASRKTVDSTSMENNLGTSPEDFINGMAEMMSHSTRTPILRTPNEYDMEHEEIFFQAMDGVTIEGRYIPGKSDKLLIFNHPMPCNRYGYPGHLEPWKNFGEFEVNFLPEYKILHDAGYNILTYDMRNHGRSVMGSGGINGHGLLEYRDVIGSLRYAKSRPDTKKMKVGLYNRYLGANATIVGMKKHTKEFKHIKAMIVLQPVTPAVFVQKALENQKIDNGLELFDKVFYIKTGFHIAYVWPRFFKCGNPSYISCSSEG